MMSLWSAVHPHYFIAFSGNELHHLKNFAEFFMLSVRQAYPDAKRLCDKLMNHLFAARKLRSKT